MVLPTDAGPAGQRRASSRVAPRFYRSSRIVTLSESSRDEIVDLLGLRRERVTVAPPGVDARYSPGGQRSADAPRRGRGPAGAGQALRRPAACAGQGEGRAARAAGRHDRRGVRAARARGAARGAGRRGLGGPARAAVDDEELVSWYRRAWVVASSSQREGWGMTLTEAAACGTPAVATAIAGPCRRRARRRVGPPRGGPGRAAVALGRVLGDEVLRSRLSKGALAGPAGSPGTSPPGAPSRRWRRRRGRCPRAERAAEPAGDHPPARWASRALVAAAAAGPVRLRESGSADTVGSRRNDRTWPASQSPQRLHRRSRPNRSGSPPASGPPSPGPPSPGAPAPSEPASPAGRPARRVVRERLPTRSPKAEITASATSRTTPSQIRLPACTNDPAQLEPGQDSGARAGPGRR